MKNSVKIPGSSLRGIVAGGLLAGSLGLGTGFGNGDYSGYEESGTEAATSEPGAGGSQVTGIVQSAALPPNVAPGWKIRVCSEKTKAASLDFLIMPDPEKSRTPASEKPYGTGGSGVQDPGTSGTADETGMGGAGAVDTAMIQETATWQSGDPSLIILPEHLSMQEKIKIQITPDRKDAKSEVCVLYNDHVAKKISIEQTSSTTVKMTETGSCGC